MPPSCLVYLAKRFIVFFYRQCGKGAHCSHLADKALITAFMSYRTMALWCAVMCITNVRGLGRHVRFR